MLRYIIEAAKDIDMKDIIKVTDEIDKEVSVMANTIAEKLIEKGIQQGLEKGIQQGLEKGIQQGLEKERELLLEAIVLRFDIIPDDIKADIEKIEDHELLKSLLRHAVKASSLQEFKSMYAKIKNKA
jgi:flagellar biosynthesis/type III secretory pathway protein FliH